MTAAKKKVIIYSDGSCLNNPGAGGYAALLIHDEKKYSEKVIYGNEKYTTNNRMELTAAIVGLKALKSPCDVTVISDSKYLVSGMSLWIKKWQTNNFLNAQKKPIPNQDLWQELLKLANYHSINWQWVKAHNGNELNERVDEIARQQAYMINN
jgi:ribonuclease HI